MLRFVLRSTPLVGCGACLSHHYITMCMDLHNLGKKREIKNFTQNRRRKLVLYVKKLQGIDHLTTFIQLKLKVAKIT